jgi:hypothetical protein
VKHGMSQAEYRDKSPENLNNDAVPAFSDYLRSRVH